MLSTQAVSSTERDEVIEVDVTAAEFSDAPKRPPPPPPKAKPARAPEAQAPARTETHQPKGKPWWEDIFTGEYVRTHERLDLETVRREAKFIAHSLNVTESARILDLACGFGDHACELASMGYSIVGFDASRDMLSVAEHNARARFQANPAYVPPTLVLGDMRELGYSGEFDAAYCWGTSFGYFEEDKNLQVLHNLRESLKERGTLMLDVVNRDYVVARSPSLVWFEGHRCICMDDMHVDFLSSRLKVRRTAMFEGGSSRELDYSMRLYSLHELGKLLRKAGFRVLQVSGHTAHPGAFFGHESPRIMVLAERG